MQRGGGSSSFDGHRYWRHEVLYAIFIAELIGCKELESVNGKTSAVKRKLEETGDEDSVQNSWGATAPRHQGQARVLTKTAYAKFRALYEEPLLHNVFVGLCAYLEVLLRYGYSIPESAMDSFVSNLGRAISIRRGSCYNLSTAGSNTASGSRPKTLRSCAVPHISYEHGCDTFTGASSHKTTSSRRSPTKREKRLV